MGAMVVARELDDPKLGDGFRDAAREHVLVLAAAQTRGILAVRRGFRARRVFPATTGFSERRIFEIGIRAARGRVRPWIISTYEFAGVVTLQRLGQVV